MQGDGARLYRSRAKITHSIATGGLSGGAILWKMCAIDRKIQAPCPQECYDLPQTFTPLDCIGGPA
jgi:hypothetical protein